MSLARLLRSGLISIPTVRRNGAARRKRLDNERAFFGHVLELVTRSSACASRALRSAEAIPDHFGCCVISARKGDRDWIAFENGLHGLVAVAGIG
jgi:hypothetical protein